jgi:hypothetical protein
MSLPNLFHGDVGGTSEAYGPDLGKESLARSPSSGMMRKRSLLARLAGRADEDGGPYRFGNLSEDMMEGM